MNIVDADIQFKIEEVKKDDL